MTIEFKLPDLGENIESGDVVNILVSEGDVIEEEQNVLELETDKAVVEVPCSHAGKIKKIHVEPGDTVEVGTTVLTLEEGQGAEKEEKKKEKKPGKKEKEEPKEEKKEEPEKKAEEKPSQEKKEEKKKEEEKPKPSGEEEEEKKRKVPPPAAPATRHLARELGVDLEEVSGSGPGGRITEEDVRSFVKKTMSEVGRPNIYAPPMPDFTQWGEVEHQKLSGIRKKTAEHMALAWHTVPHVTQFDVADITDLESARKRYMQGRGDKPGKITMTVLALKAAVAAIKAFPQFNASIDVENEELILKKYFHIGVAVDTDAGLLVPVIRDADRKSVLQLAVELEELAEKARNRKLGPDQMQGGTFTITNLGGIAGTAFTPVVNFPEVAILGISRGRKEQLIIDDEPRIRRTLPLSLSYDHRAIDGADGARFLKKVAEVLSDPMQLLLEG